MAQENHECRLIEEYLAEFVSLTENEDVFDQDFSDLDVGPDLRNALQDEERAQRENWNLLRDTVKGIYTIEKVYQFQQHFRPSNQHPNQQAIPKTKHGYLSFRIAPPFMSNAAIASRLTASSAQRRRKYPRCNQVRAWDGFNDEVVRYKPVEDGPGVLDGSDPFMDSLTFRPICGSEYEEHVFIAHILEGLSAAALIRHTTRSSLRSTEPAGVPDRFLERIDTTVVATIECKATHNLLLPSTGAEIEVVYRNNFQSMPQWKNTAPHLAQIINYMCGWGVRFGVLTSATRTYFLRAGVGGAAGAHETDSIIQVSDAFFVANKDYLRAWAYFYSAGFSDRGGWQPPKDWNSDPDAPNEGDDSKGHETEEEDLDEDRKSSGKRDRNDGQAPKRQRQDRTSSSGGFAVAKFRKAVSSAIPWIDNREVEVADLLGRGNNTVHLARWNGKNIALKSFDLYKSYDRFRSEVRAYEHLKSAWGVLVPKPYFVSRNWGAMWLGVQLGRDPTSDDNSHQFFADKRKLLQSLKSDYGFHHLDMDRGNVIYIADDAGNERLVAIDLESHEIKSGPDTPPIESADE